VTRTKELSRSFNVSIATIRRDLAQLERRGLLRRTRGGALLPQKGQDPYEVPYELKSSLKLHEKIRIAEAAACLIKPGDTVILDSGSTTFQLAKRIKGMSITVIALDVILASELARGGNADVVVIGGQVRRGFYSIVGRPAEEMLKTMHVAKTFLSADSVHLETGVTNVTLAEAPIKDLAIKAAREVILVVDSSKFGQIAPFKVCDLESVDHIITDSGLPSEIADGIRSRGISLDIV